MRGKQWHLVFGQVLKRITPAHAGKTAPVFVTIVSIADHPRTCGENSFIAPESEFNNGSPPHMRGKRDKFKQYVGSLRITPAHAGKTC